MTRRSFPSVRLAAGLCALSVVAGCAGNGPPPPDSSSSFDQIQQTVFNKNCLGAGCHNSSDRSGNLVLEAGASYDNLVNAIPLNATAQTNGLRRVVPGDPDHSFLLIKLTGPGPGEEDRMPLSAPPLSDANIALIRNWILAGAPGSSVATPTSSSTPSSTSTVTPTNSATSTATPSFTTTPTLTSTPSVSPTGTRPATPTPSATVPPTLTPTASATASVTATVTATPSASPIPTPTFSLASTFPQIQATIFTPTCLDLSCHNANDHGGSLVLEAGVAYANLAGPPPPTPANTPASQAGMLRVDPGNPANSFLITKLTLPTAFDSRFMSRMPLGKQPLTAEQIDNIRAWILRGALPDEAPPSGN